MRKIALLLLIAVCMAPCAGFAQDAVVGEDIVAGYSLNRSGDS